MHKLFVAVLALAVFACSTGRCFAVLGETEVELEARYGKPTEIEANPDWAKPADKEITFSSRDGMGTAVLICRGRSVGEFHNFSDVNNANSPVKDNAEAAAARLVANSRGGEWVGGKEPDGSFLWINTSGAGALVRKVSPHRLEIWDSKFQAEMMKAAE